jgi:hypothetical protein
MEILEAVGGAAAFVVIVLCCLLARRILLLRGGGTIEMSLRLGTRGHHGRGWALGVGRFLGDELQWFRTFSLAPRPKLVLRRMELSVVERRQPAAAESLALMTDSIVLHCESSRGPIELAIAEGALTGFQSWLESAPPGANFQPFAAG